MLKQSISENKIKKKKTKKNENKRKRSGSANKINNNKTNLGIITKNNSLDDKKSPIGKPNLGNSSDEIENINIKMKKIKENFNSSDENRIEKNKQKRRNNNNHKNNCYSNEERNSSNNENTTDKPENEISSDEIIIKSDKNKEKMNKNININNNSKMEIDKDSILTVCIPENTNVEQELISSNSQIGNQNKNNNQVNNKMSWRKMTKGNLKIKIN